MVNCNSFGSSDGGDSKVDTPPKCPKCGTKSKHHTESTFECVNLACPVSEFKGKKVYRRKRKKDCDTCSVCDHHTVCELARLIRDFDKRGLFDNYKTRLSPYGVGDIKELLALTCLNYQFSFADEIKTNGREDRVQIKPKKE